MATYKSAVSGLAAEVNVFYDRLLLTIAVPLLVYGAFGQARSLPKNAGTDTIKFRRYGLFTAATTPLTEATTPAGSTASVTDITSQIGQYGDFTLFSDVVTDQTQDPLLTELTMLFGQQMGNTNDQITRDIIVAGTTVNYASTAVSRVTVAAGFLLDATAIGKAQRTLAGANAQKLTGFSAVSQGYETRPIPPAYVGVCHPRTSYDVRNATGFTPVEKYNPNISILPGEIGTVNQCRFVETTNGKVFTGAGAAGIDVYATIFIGANGYGIVDLGNSQAAGVIYQPLGASGSADPLKQRGSLGWKEYFAAKILNDAFLCRVEHAVSA